MARIVVIDNYDSFVYNLVQYLQQLGADCEVHRNDAITPEQIAERRPDGVLLSPGPGTPADAGVSEAVVRWSAATETPLLGVCLGHQAIAEVYGGTVDRAAELMHGRTSLIEHCGVGLFADLPQPFTATRYHSLAVVDGTLGPDVEITARTDGGAIMGIRHTRYPLQGVQFHPESVLSECGHRLLANWLTDCGDQAVRDLVPPLESAADRIRLQAH